MEVGAVLGGWGRWSRRKRMEFGVSRAEMCDEANWSMRFRYLRFFFLVVRRKTNCLLLRAERGRRGFNI